MRVYHVCRNRRRRPRARRASARARDARRAAGGEDGRAHARLRDHRDDRAHARALAAAGAGPSGEAEVGDAVPVTVAPATLRHDTRRVTLRHGMEWTGMGEFHCHGMECDVTSGGGAEGRGAAHTPSRYVTSF